MPVGKKFINLKQLKVKRKEDIKERGKMYLVYDYINDRRISTPLHLCTLFYDDNGNYLKPTSVNAIDCGICNLFNFC